MDHNLVLAQILLLLANVFVAFSEPTTSMNVLVGGEVALPCYVDTKACGELHSVKFYRETDRIIVYSKLGISRGKADATQRMNVEYSAEDGEARLIIKQVEIGDEANYKCEITYLLVRENCDVIQMIKLETLVKPTEVRILEANGNPLANSSSFGPYNEETAAELTCEAHGGRPIPKIKWYNGTKPIKSDYKGIDTGNGTGTAIGKLRMTLMRGDLKKEFKCIVESKALEEPIVSTVIADVNVSPFKPVLTGVKDHVVQDSFVKMLCNVSGAKPEADVKWYNNSYPMLESLIRTERVIMDDGTTTTLSTLEFTASRFDHDQVFECVTENSVSREKGEHSRRDLIVLKVYYPPVVTVHPSNKTVNETDKNVLLRCSYSANPEPLEDALWAKDGKNITLNAEKYEGGVVGDLSLLIKYITREDHGNYSCFCKNIVGSQESEKQISLNVLYPPTVELEILSEMPVKAIQEKNITLVCNVTQGNPSTLQKVKWFLDDELLRELPECNYSSYDKKGKGEGYGGPFCSIDPHVLSLVNVSESFAGNYTCQGQTVAGWGPRSEPQELIVYYPPSAATLRAIPPKVIKKASLTLYCSVSDLGRPENVTYVWYRGNRHISDVTTANWTIAPVTFETKSNYTCYASNDGGSGPAASVYVNVTAPPAFIQNLQPYQGILHTNNNISLTCRVECSPMCSLIWLRNGQEIFSRDHHYRIVSTQYPPDVKKNDFESIESTLVFNLKHWPGEQLDRTAANSFYTCQSSQNEAGPGVNSTTEIAVDYPPENLTVSRTVVDVVENEKPETITCNGKGHPTLTFLWKNQQGVNVSASNVLSFKQAKMTDAGKYTCEAYNKHGNMTTIAYLNVQYAPSCTLELIDPNGTPTLECTAKANPEEVDFRFHIKGENESVDTALITQDGIRGYLEVDAGDDIFRTYQCIVNNSVGVGTACERDVVGVAPWWRQLFGENLILICAILAGIVLIVILCIIIILICRRKRGNNKLPNQSSIGDKGGVGSAPPGGGLADPDPDKLFYENLPFHGIQNPPNKPYRPDASELDYADVDYRSYGPINYKAASIYAAMKRKKESGKLEEKDDDLL